MLNQFPYEPGYRELESRRFRHQLEIVMQFSVDNWSRDCPSPKRTVIIISLSLSSNVTQYRIIPGASHGRESGLADLRHLRRQCRYDVLKDQ